MKARSVTELSDVMRLLALVLLAGAVLWMIRTIKGAGLSETITEGERGLVYRYGRFDREVGPGKHWMVFGRRIVRVPINEQTFIVANQEVMSADRMSVKVSALATFKITQPRKAMEKAKDGYRQPIYYAAQMAIRDVVSQQGLEAMLDTRTALDVQLKDSAKQAFAEHGCDLVSLSLRDLILPSDVRRLATDVTRAKLEAVAALERARGEQASLRALSNAARLIKGNPELMNLRVLQALSGGPGKTAPTVILSGGAGIVPIPPGQPASASEGNDGTS